MFPGHPDNWTDAQWDVYERAQARKEFRQAFWRGLLCGGDPMIEYNPKDVRVVVENGRYYVESKWFLFFWERLRDGWDEEADAIQAAMRVYAGIQARRNAHADTKPRIIWER
jgi:hypothetical protein